MLPLVFLSIFPAALVIAALNDLYEFKIPNWISVLMVAGFVAGGFVMNAPLQNLIEGIALGAAALVVGFILFARSIIGGGDAKLLAATAMWVGIAGLSSFLVATALSGGLFALVLILFRRTPALPIYAQAPWLLRLHQSPKDIPYAVAIALGGLLSFKETPYFQMAFGG